MRQGRARSPRRAGSTTRDFDVIVVGAGPAGATLALYGTAHGLSILLVDQATFPRDKVCGDVIPGACFEILDELGLSARLMSGPHRCIAKQVFYTDRHSLRPHGEDNYGGLVVRRLVFDELLFREAQERVETRQGFRVVDLLYDRGRVCGVRGSTRGGVRDHTAKVVVGADGAGSVVARRLGRDAGAQPATAVASRVYYRGVRLDCERLELHFLRECLPGYFWIFPVDGGLANVGVGLFRRDHPRPALHEVHRRLESSPLLGRRFGGAIRSGPARGWPLPMASERRTLCADGCLLVGDAGGLIDPFWGHGIDGAMISGKIAAGVLATVCRGDDFGSQALSAYATAVWQRLGAAFDFGQALHETMRSPPLTFPLESRLEILRRRLFAGNATIAERQQRHLEPASPADAG